MHRQFSLQPFSRHYSHSTNPFLDFLELPASGYTGNPQICVSENKVAELYPILEAYKQVQHQVRLHPICQWSLVDYFQGTLLPLQFVTLPEYLFLLRSVSKELSALGLYAPLVNRGVNVGT